MKKRIISILLCVTLLLSVSGCDMQTEEKPHLGFSNGELFKDEKQVIMPVDALPYDTVKWDDYRGSLHYEQLTEGEKTVYRALEYALENGYTNILVDAEVAPNGKILEKAINALSLDSPMLEQNLRCEIGTFTTYYPTMLFGLIETQTVFTGNYITVQNFSADQLEKKQQALAAAEKIVSDLPKDLTQKEKAETLFTYLCEHTVYELYPVSGMVYPYLYDGLVTGKTQCDGFANSLSLLLNMIDIESVEKEYTGNEDAEVGHTWNFFQLDGVWYNADATGGQGKEKEKHQYFFGFPDQLQEHVPENAEAYPASEQGLHFQIDAHLKDSAELKTTLKAAYNANDNRWALLVVDKITEKQIRSAAQSLANAIDSEVHYMHMELAEGRTALWFYNEKYFK